MEDGCLDPWDHGVWFGIRRFEVFGVRYDTKFVVSNKKPITVSPDSSSPSFLVDNNSGTVWKSKSDKSWFDVDLKKICAVSDIKFDWADGARADKIKVNCFMQSMREKEKGEVSGKGTPEKMQLDSVLATHVRVSLKGGAHELEGVEVRGVEYGVKDVLKMVVDYEMKEHVLVREHITTAIDEWTYTDY